MSPVQRISQIVLVCQQLDRSVSFYEDAFGFVQTSDTVLAGAALATLIGIPKPGVRVVSLRLGNQEIELIEIHPHGRAYPAAVAGWSPLFQHFAIVVPDMAASYAQLSAQRGWTPISLGGPQSLPISSGGVQAYKLRDPEGHPLELIAFPLDATPGPWQTSSTAASLGIDHSAISVADTAQSVAFYEQFGLRRIGGSFNAGSEQNRLDDVPQARVEVTAMALPECPAPRLELLCYRGAFDRNVSLPDSNDVAATRLVLSVESGRSLEAICRQVARGMLSGPVRFDDGVSRALLRDPDGHLLCLKAPARSAVG